MVEQEKKELCVSARAADVQGTAPVKANPANVGRYIRVANLQFDRQMMQLAGLFPRGMFGVVNGCNRRGFRGCQL